MYLVREIALGRGEHQLDIRWHFAPDLEVQAVSPGRIEISRQGAQSGESRLSLIVPDETVWHASTQVTKTLLSPAYGASQPASLVQSSARLSLPAETATALLPGTVEIHQNNDPLIGPHMASVGQPDVQVYELDYHGKSHAFFFALGNANQS